MSASNRGTARRRLGLLTGGSLMAATIAAVAGGVALAPGAARAANECGDPNANGATADTFQCTDAAAFAAITYPATNGNLTLQLQNDVTVTTGGLVITPTGANTVTVSRIADSVAGAGDPHITSTTGAGISIIRPAGANGAITVTLTDNDTDDAPMSVTGTTAGVLLLNGGTAATNLTTTNGTITATSGVGVQLGTTGTGNVLFANRSVVSGTTGAVHVTAGVNATLNNNAPLNGVSGVLLGRITFDNTGNVGFNNSGVWRSEGVNNLGSGASTFTNQATGTLVIGGASQGAATLTLSGLETFNNNSGRVLFGSNADFTATDGVVNDRLVAAANYTGNNFQDTSLAVLVMDVVLGGTQADCSAVVTADCFDLRGGSAEGSTGILVNPVVGAGGGGFGVRQVLVDLSGAGALEDGAFVLSPDSAGYREVLHEAPLIDAGPVVYRLFQDADAKQVYLTGAPDGELAQLVHLGEGVQAVWDLTATGWLEQQAGHRFNDGESGRGVWLRGLAGQVENTVSQSFVDGAFVHDTSYQQRSMGLAGGVDIVGTEMLRAGVTAGYVNSEIKDDPIAMTLELKGYTFGAYASVLAGNVFLDAIVNHAKLDVSSPGLASAEEATSTGVQAEAGYRFVTPAGIAVIEPLVAVAYVGATPGDATFADGSVASFDDASSLRAAVGLRVAGETGADVVARFSFTGRIWQILEGEAGVDFDGGGVSDGFTYEDDRDLLGDAAVSFSLTGLAPGLSFDASARIKVKEDYQAGEVGVGLRYAF